MKVLRLAGAAVILVAAAGCAYQFVFRPLACHRLKGEVVLAAYEAYESRPPDTARASEILARLEPCHTPGCRDVRLFFIAAISARTLGRTELALHHYRESLRYDHRPETYANIGEMLLALGDREGAFENYLRATLFHPAYLRLIDDGALRERVRAELLRLRPDQESVLERVDSPRFRRRFP